MRIATIVALLVCGSNELTQQAAADPRAPAAPAPVVLTGHTGAVKHLAVVGSKVVSGGADASVRVWDAGREVARWNVAELQGIAVVGSRVATLARDPSKRARLPAGKTTKGADADASLITLDVRDLDGRHLQPRALGDRTPEALGARPDGTLVLASRRGVFLSKDRAVPAEARIVWRRPGSQVTKMLPGGVPVQATGHALFTLEDDERFATGCTAFAHAAGDAAATRLAIADGKRDVRLWSRGRPDELTHTIHLPASVVVYGDGVITADGTVLFPVARGVMLWEPARRRLSRVDGGRVSAIAVGEAVAFGFDDGRIELWPSLAAVRAAATLITAVGAPAAHAASGLCGEELKEQEALMIDLLTAEPAGADEGNMSKRRPGGDLENEIRAVKNSAKPVAVGGGAGRGSGRSSGKLRIDVGGGGPPGRISIGPRQAFDRSSLTVDQVAARLSSVYMAGITRCYRQLLASTPSARGMLTLTFTVDAVGRVMSAKAHGFSTEVDTCVLDQAANWRFPIPRDRGGEVTDAAFAIGLQLVPE